MSVSVWKEFWQKGFLLVFLFLFFVGGCATNQSQQVTRRPNFYTPPDWKKPIVIKSREEAPKRPTQIVDTAINKVKDKIRKLKEILPAEKKTYEESSNASASLVNSHSTFSDDDHQMRGLASWYGPGFHGKLTANGEVYDQDNMTAAHKILPIGTWVRIHNLENKKSTVVRINDRGPYKKNRIIDLSRMAAKKLGIFKKGTADVVLEVVKYPQHYDRSKGLKAYKQAVVQVAVFQAEHRATTFRKQLASRYSKTTFFVDELRPGFFHVVAGPFNNRSEADKVARYLKTDGIPNFVRSYRK